MLEEEKDSSLKSAAVIGFIQKLKLKSHVNDHTLAQKLKLSTFERESETTSIYNKVEVLILISRCLYV